MSEQRFPTPLPLRHRSDSLGPGDVSPASGRVGVGLQLTHGKDGLVVNRVLVDGPASRSEAGIRVGDHLTHVDGAAVGSDLSHASSLILGAPGCEVTLDFQRGESRITAVLTRNGDFAEWRHIELRREQGQPAARAGTRDSRRSSSSSLRRPGSGRQESAQETWQRESAVLAERATSWLYTQISGMAAALSPGGGKVHRTPPGGAGAR